MKKSRKLAPSKYLRKYGKAKISRPMITKEEVEAVLECEITDERYEELLEASRMYSLSNSDKHVNLAQDAEHNRDWEGAKKHWKNAALASIKHDTVHKTQRSDKLKVRGITMRKEEKEQIDEDIKSPNSSGQGHDETHKEHPYHHILNSHGFEYSHSTPIRYPSGIRTHHTYARGERKIGVDNTSGWESKKSSASGHSTNGNGANALERHVKRLKEEVEQIDELSNKTLKSYIKKGSRDMKITKRNMEDSDGPDDAGESNGDYGKLQRRFSKRWKGFNTAIRSKGTAVKEAVELSSSRKDKVNSLLAKHQSKGLPKKSAKKYTREYTGDGLPLIAAVINQEETLNESRSDRRERPKHVDSNSKRSSGYPPKNKVTKQITNSKERAGKKQFIRKAMDESSLEEWKKSTTTKHTCGGVSFGKKAPKGDCPRCDELHDGHAPVKWDHSKRDSDIQRSKEIKAHDCKKSKCGPVCTFGDW
jgi:hypothetical protein